MGAATIPLFFVASVSLFLIVFYIYTVVSNKRVETITGRFIESSRGLSPILFKNVKTRYYVINGLKEGASPNNWSDLYLFGSNLVIVRRQKYIFTLLFAPIVVTGDMALARNAFGYLEIHKPDSVAFKQILKGEVDIKLSDRTYPSYKTVITLKGLTDEQINLLQRITNWC
jgi:hypothetical protein